MMGPPTPTLKSEIFATRDDYFRAYADAALDAFSDSGLSSDALELAALPYLEPDDAHPILFTVT